MYTCIYIYIYIYGHICVNPLLLRGHTCIPPVSDELQPSQEFRTGRVGVFSRETSAPCRPRLNDGHIHNVSQVCFTYSCCICYCWRISCVYIFNSKTNNGFVILLHIFLLPIIYVRIYCICPCIHVCMYVCTCAPHV